MHSSFWREVMAEGRAEGSLRTSRKLCAALARRHHPELTKRLLPMIERCTDVALLQSGSCARSAWPKPASARAR